MALIQGGCSELQQLSALVESGIAELRRLCALVEWQEHELAGLRREVDGLKTQPGVEAGARGSAAGSGPDNQDKTRRAARSSGRTRKGVS